MVFERGTRFVEGQVAQFFFPSEKWNCVWYVCPFLWWRVKKEVVQEPARFAQHWSVAFPIFISSFFASREKCEKKPLGLFWIRPLSLLPFQTGWSILKLSHSLRTKKENKKVRGILCCKELYVWWCLRIPGHETFFIRYHPSSSSKGWNSFFGSWM